MSQLFCHQEEEDYEPESPTAKVVEDIPSDDSLSPGQTQIGLYNHTRWLEA